MSEPPLRSADIHVAFVMDAPDSLNVRKDSTLAMIRAAQRRGWRVTVLGIGDMAVQHGQVMGWLRDYALTPAALDDLDGADAADYYRLGPPARMPLADADLVLMRKDPPVDMAYIHATYLLERAVEEGATVVNAPDGLRDCNEKLYATRFREFAPPHIVSARKDLLVDFHAEHGDVVFKPLNGMGGMGVFRVRPDDTNLRVVIETLTGNGRRPVMAQRHLPEISAGDKRVLLIGGSPVPHAIARVPMAGEGRGNLAAGGRGVGQPVMQ